MDGPIINSAADKESEARGVNAIRARNTKSVISSLLYMLKFVSNVDTFRTCGEHTDGETRNQRTNDLRQTLMETLRLMEMLESRSESGDRSCRISGRRRDASCSMKPVWLYPV